MNSIKNASTPTPTPTRPIKRPIPVWPKDLSNRVEDANTPDVTRIISASSASGINGTPIRSNFTSPSPNAPSDPSTPNKRQKKSNSDANTPDAFTSIASSASGASSDNGTKYVPPFFSPDATAPNTSNIKRKSKTPTSTSNIKRKRKSNSDFTHDAFTSIASSNNYTPVAPSAPPKEGGAGVEPHDSFFERILQGTNQRNCTRGGTFGSCENSGELYDKCKADPDSNAHVRCTRNSNNGHASVCACEQCEELRNSSGALSRTSSAYTSPVRSRSTTAYSSPEGSHDSSVTPSLNWSPEFLHLSFSTKKLTRTDTVYSTGSADSEDSTNTVYSTGSVWGNTLPHRSDSNESNSSNRSDWFDGYGFRYNQDDDKPYYHNPDSDFSSDA